MLEAHFNSISLHKEEKEFFKQLHSHLSLSLSLAALFRGFQRGKFLNASHVGILKGKENERLSVDIPFW